MIQNDKPANVHYIGDGKYGIGIWSNRNAQYTCPLDATERHLTGCFAEFARKPIGNMSERKARYEARKRYGYSKLSR